MNCQTCGAKLDSMRGRYIELAEYAQQLPTYRTGDGSCIHGAEAIVCSWVCAQDWISEQRGAELRQKREVSHADDNRPNHVR